MGERHHYLSMRSLIAPLVLLAAAASAPAATVLTNNATWAFGDLLLYRNATSKGWNFGNTAANAPATMLLGVPFASNLGVNDAATGLTFTTAPSTYAIGGFAWGGAPEQAARDNLSKGGLHGGAGNYAMKFATTPGKTYVLEIVALDAFAAGGRSMDIVIDNVTVIDEWFLPVGAPYNKLARIEVVADADGVDLRMARGSTAGTDQNPAISAVALTEVLNAPPAFSVHPCDQTQPVGGTATFSVTASGAPVPTLQWRKNGSPISGQTGTTLALTGLSAADVTTYDCVATNDLGSSTSNAASLTLVSLVTANPVTADLKGYWRFDETSGCSAADTSGQHRSGNLVNFPLNSAAHWTAGKVGGALRFGGPATQQHVIVPSVPLPTAQNYTIAAWVQADSRPLWASIAKNWFGFTHFGIDAGGGQLSNYFGLSPSGQIRVAETEVFPLSTWQHVVCTAENGTLNLYRNGVLTATQAFTGSLYSPLPAPMGVGAKLNGASAAADGTAGYWHGLIDDLALWHRTLSAREIATLYAAGVQGQSLDNPNPQPPATALVISEFLGDNSGGALDEDYDSSDWIELYNGTAAPVNLDGYHLTDDRLDLTKWRFPAVTLPAGGYLLVWASNKDRRVPGQPLHTSFSLSDGEELYLVAPDGTSIVYGYTSPLAATEGNNVTFFDRYPDETNVSYGIQGGAMQFAYFKTPTPGGANGAVTQPYGPVITQEAHTPAQPTPGTAVTVTARIRPEQDEVDDGSTTYNFIFSATLTYRVMYGAESSVPMRDDGTGGDALAGDNIWTGVIPGTHGATAGQMLRWSISGTSAQGTSRRSPQFLLPDSVQYHGTVIADATLTTPLPVLHRFVETPALADTEGGTFCSIFFNGEFHDRCRIRMRGNTSRTFPKKSHKIDLPPGRRVPLKLVPAGQPEPPQVSELNINTTYTDKSYVRALMAAEMHALSGIPSPEIYHVHQRENGAFYSVALFVENVDDIFLEKHGIDEHGAFYKAVGDNGACDFTTASAYEKKNRPTEGYADLESVVANLGLTGTALETWLFDNVDIATWVNWHAGSVISQNIDASNKNYYIYRDTLGSREWSVLPWDLDLTFGPNQLNNDVIVFNQNNPATPQCTSHPLIGARPWQLHINKYNRMIEAMANTPRVRTMIARRLRSLNDQFLATSWFQNRMDALAPVLTNDVNADRAKWGSSAHFGGTMYTMAQSIARIKNEHLAGRSGYLMSTHGGVYSLNFSTGAGSLGAPLSQPAAPSVNIVTAESNPASGNQDQEYIEIANPNAFDVDLSAWTLEGGVTFTFPGGTVLPAEQSLFVTPDRYAFRQRAVSPRGGERRFVTGPYSGHLNNFGEVLTLKNAAGTVISTFSVPPAPSDVQQHLAISEIYYNPPGAADDTEYLEFVNTSASVTLDLAGVKITAGLTGEDALGAPVYFTFAPGTTLAPGARVLVVRNAAAFQAAWPAVPAGQIAGTFPAGTVLDNGGELLKVDDATGSTVVQFTYDDVFQWSTLPDGSGHSLVHMNPAAGDAHHANPANWRASAAAGGSPGSSDALPPPANPAGDDDGDGLNNLLEHVMGEGAPFSAVRQPDGSVLLTWAQRPGGDAGRIVVESSADLVTWQAIPSTGEHGESFAGGMILHSATQPAAAGTRIYYRASVLAP